VTRSREPAELDEALRAQLQAAGTATVHEAAGRIPLLDPALRPLQQGVSLAAVAFTAECGINDNLAVHRAVAAAPKGSVLVVDAGGDAGGYWGGILTEAALARGLAGLVMDGGVRDVASIRALGFPVWSRHVAARGVEKTQPGKIGESARCGGIAISTGMVIVADDDGVVAVDISRVEEVSAAASARTEREAALIGRLRGGELTLDLLDLRRHIVDDGDR